MALASTSLGIIEDERLPKGFVRTQAAKTWKIEGQIFLGVTESNETLSQARVEFLSLLVHEGFCQVSDDHYDI